MNIIEAYIKFKGQLVILVSGLSGSGKSILAKSIQNDFRIQGINLESFCKSDFSKMVTLSDSTKINDWDDIESYDWDRFNRTINETKSQGCVVVGPHFITEKLSFQPDYHFHVKISKDKLIEHRKKYIVENPDKCQEVARIVDQPVFNNMINKITFAHYYDYISRSKIDMFLNSGELSDGAMSDQAINWMFKKIQIFLDERNKQNVGQNVGQNVERNANKNTKSSFTQSVSDDERISAIIDRSTSDSDDVDNSDDSDEPIYLGTENKVELVY
jgi:predicted ATPase